MRNWRVHSVSNTRGTIISSAGCAKLRLPSPTVPRQTQNVLTLPHLPQENVGTQSKHETIHKVLCWKGERIAHTTISSTKKATNEKITLWRWTKCSISAADPAAVDTLLDGAHGKTGTSLSGGRGAAPTKGHPPGPCHFVAVDRQFRRSIRTYVSTYISPSGRHIRTLRRMKPPRWNPTRESGLKTDDDTQVASSNSNKVQEGCNIAEQGTPGFQHTTSSVFPPHPKHSWMHRNCFLPSSLYISMAQIRPVSVVCCLGGGVEETHKISP